MLRKSLIVMAVLAAVLLAATDASAQWRGMGRLTGKIVDETGAPVTDLTIKAEFGLGGTTEVKTNAKGEFTLGGIAAGEWQLTIAKEGCVTVKYRTTVREMAVLAPVNVTLKKKS
jgi:hypothetical protein